ncbi:MAG TPA: VCBS repeat-containing protein [Nitrososphaeraceae archaeon]|nr:VCBS repeat-containing protein [Nitrososphaeraceae archaeon]
MIQLAGYGAPTSLPTGSSPLSIAVADFNNDGNSVLAVTNAGDDNVSILLGNGEGEFSDPVNFPVGEIPIDIAVGNFN